jgi:hypothetical protein
MNTGLKIADLYHGADVITAPKCGSTLRKGTPRPNCSCITLQHLEFCWIHANACFHTDHPGNTHWLFRTADIIAPTFGGALSRYWNPFEMWQDFTGGVL